MQIKFDYRFDTQGFFSSEYRSALDYAGTIWSDLLQDNFREVSSATELTIVNPQTGVRQTLTYGEEIEDLVIFVGAADNPFNNLQNNSLAEGQYFGTEQAGDIFQRRISDDFRGMGAVTDFEPWVGGISFATNPEGGWNLDLDTSDRSTANFVSTALSAIGSVLGIDTAPIFAELTVNGSFVGVNVRELNNGEPLPLDRELDSLVLGTASSPTELDLAFLADIGYQIAGYQKQGATPELATAEAETILGSSGSDRLRGFAGNDTILGSSGSDTLLGDEGNDSLQGNAGSDTLNGGLGDDLLQGESGSDLLLGSAGVDTLEGGEGNDTIRGNDGNDLLLGGEGDDSLIGNSDNDSLQGNEGDDRVRGGDAGDTLEGNDGNDTLEGGRGNDILTGGTGSDRFEFGFDFGRDRVTDFGFNEDRLSVSARYDFATDSYDLNTVAEILAEVDSTTIGDGSTITEIKLRETETIEVVHQSDGNISSANVDLYLPFQSQIAVNNSGFTIQLNKDFDFNRLNLYQGVNREANIPDLRLVANSTGKVIEGSLIQESDRSLRFVKTNGVLTPDEYSLTLFSRGDSFLSDEGELLDGDLDGIAGENFISAFAIEATEQRVLNLNDLSQEAGARVSSTSTEGLNISLDEGIEVAEISFRFTYDASLLEVEDIVLNPELEDSWRITKDLSNPGEAIVSLAGDSLSAGEVDLVSIEGTVPQTATTGSSAVLNLEAVQINQGAILAAGDAAVQLVNQVGDTNGDSRYSSTDTRRLSYLATGITDGITDFDTIDPNLIADINRDGVVSALDSYLVYQLGNS